MAGRSLPINVIHNLFNLKPAPALLIGNQQVSTHRSMTMNAIIGRSPIHRHLGLTMPLYTDSLLNATPHTTK